MNRNTIRTLICFPAVLLASGLTGCGGSGTSSGSSTPMIPKVIVAANPGQLFNLLAAPNGMVVVENSTGTKYGTAATGLTAFTTPSGLGSGTVYVTQLSSGGLSACGDGQRATDGSLVNIIWNLTDNTAKTYDTSLGFAGAVADGGLFFTSLYDSSGNPSYATVTPDGTSTPIKAFGTDNIFVVGFDGSNNMLVGDYGPAMGGSATQSKPTPKSAIHASTAFHMARTILESKPAGTTRGGGGNYQSFFYSSSGQKIQIPGDTTSWPALVTIMPDGECLGSYGNDQGAVACAWTQGGGLVKYNPLPNNGAATALTSNSKWVGGVSGDERDMRAMIWLKGKADSGRDLNKILGYTNVSYTWIEIMSLNADGTMTVAGYDKSGNIVVVSLPAPK